MRDISRERFNMVAGYCRSPLSVAVSEEVRWLESIDGNILATVVRDMTDDDFAGMILARDLKQRFRWIGATEWFESPEDILTPLITKIDDLTGRLDEVSVQGDEEGSPVDFFSPIVPSHRLHSNFLRLAFHKDYSAARGVIEPMMRWYDDVDGNFIEQFQTTGFDARIWELYLFATLVEAGYGFDRSQPVPDFVVGGLLGNLCIEATTVNPTVSGALVPPSSVETAEDRKAYFREFVPLKFAGPLTAKLAKRYWERSNIADIPLVFAIQDFHAPMSMTETRTGLATYLYGYDYDWHHETDGTLVVLPRRVATHRWGTKVIRSGFFSLSEAENISAVIFNSGGTLSKFNRIGVETGFGSQQVLLVRSGFALNHDPNSAHPKSFKYVVKAGESRESWIEGMDVFHNPNAKHPLIDNMLPGAAHHHFRSDSQIETFSPSWHPLSSVTTIMIQEPTETD